MFFRLFVTERRLPYVFCLFATYTLLLLLLVVTNQPSTLRDSFTLRYAGLGVRLHGKKLIPYYSAFQSFAIF